MKTCPLLKKPCIEHQCEWYMLVQGKHPQTGADIDKWGCAINWLPLLMIENSQQQRQTGAAVESLRNAHTAVTAALMSQARGGPKLLEE